MADPLSQHLTISVDDSSARAANARTIEGLNANATAAEKSASAQAAASERVTSTLTRGDAQMSESLRRRIQDYERFAALQKSSSTGVDRSAVDRALSSHSAAVSKASSAYRDHASAIKATSDAHIQAESSARKLVDANKAIDSSSQASGSRLEELGAAGVAAYSAVGTQAGRYVSQTVQAAASTDNLKTKMVALIATAAIALSVEESLRRAYNRGGEINAQAFTAAGTNNSFAGVEQLTALAKARGLQSSTFITASQDLNRGIRTDAGQSALTSLGLHDLGSDIENLKQLSVAFSNIQDPVERASKAIALFGPSAQTILPELDRGLSTSAQHMQDWGIEIGRDRSAEITRFTKQVNDLKSGLGDFSDWLTATGIKVGNTLNYWGAKAGNAVLDARNAVVGTAQSYLGVAAGAAITGLGLSGIVTAPRQDIQIPEADAILEAIRKQFPGGFIPADKNDQVRAAAERVGQNIASDVAKVANGNTDAQLSVAQQQLKAVTQQLYNAYNPTTRTYQLGSSQLLALGSTFQRDKANFDSLTAQKAQEDAAKKAADDAASAAIDAQRRNSELTKTLAQLAIKNEDRGPVGELYEAIQRARTTVDKNGDTVTANLNSQQQILAARAFAGAVSEMQKKTSAEAVKQLEEEQSLALRYADELFQKRQQKEAEIGSITREVMAKGFELQRSYLDSSHQTAINALALSDPNPVEKIAGSLAIASKYANDSAILDIEKVQRDLLKNLADRGLSLDASYDNPDQARLRSKVIENSAADATTIAQKNAAALLGINQQTAIDSANLIKESNDKTFDALRGGALSVISDIESRGKGAFAAIAETLKSSILGALNQVIASQVAGSLFSAFSPTGSKFAGFDSTNGIPQTGLGGLFQRLGGFGSSPKFSGGTTLVPAYAGGAPAGDTNFNSGPQFLLGSSSTGLAAGGSSFGSLPAMMSYPQLSDSGALTLTPDVPEASIINGTFLNHNNPYQVPALPPMYNPSAGAVSIPGYSSPMGVSGGGGFASRFGVSPSLLSQLVATAPGADVSGSTYQLGGVSGTQAAAYQAGSSSDGMPTMFSDAMANYPQLAFASAPGGTPGVPGGDGMPTMLAGALANYPQLMGSLSGGGTEPGPEAIPNALALAEGAQAGYSGIPPLANYPQMQAHSNGLAALAGVGTPGGTLEHLATKSGLSLSALQGTFYNSGSIALGAGVSTTAAGISQAAGGGILGNLAGGAAGVLSSPAAGALGASLYLNGISAKNQTLGTSIETVGGAALAGFKAGGVSGAITGAGIGLVSDGLKRGGGAGILEDSAGGAAIGFEYGGPIGAVIGAAVGAGAGIIRLFVKTNDDEIIQLVKNNYHINISRQFADQINQIAKQSFNGSIHAAVQSPQVLQLLQLYAESTGQKFGALNIVRPLQLTDTAKNGLQQGAFYQGGQAYSFQSNVLNGVYGGVSTTQVNPYQIIPTTSAQKGSYYAGQGSQPSPSLGPQSIVVHNTVHNSISGDDVSDFLNGNTISTISSNPRVVASAVATAQNGSYDTNSAAARLLSPGQLFS